jgi:NAD(P)-dependent dehydrogenase (short-subunit alcohol dehydrogenase family)
MPFDRLSKIAPIIRGLLAEPSGNDDIPYYRVILKFFTNRKPDDFVGPGKMPPLYVDLLEYDASSEKLREQLSAAVKDFSKTHGSKPQVVLLPDVGVLYVEETIKTGLPLRNEVALVTGAAGAIGSGICRGLLKKGCYVAATDLPGENLDGLVNELKETTADRIIGVGLNVTDRDSVADGFNEVSRVWGGVDIVIVNAGIPLIASLVEMDINDFRRLEKVNVEGTLLTLSEAGRHLRLQGTGGDIVMVSTKNVFAPGARFGAYSATKAAAHQLGRIASLELAEFGIRVNMVAPDAVFSAGKRKSGLWEKIGPDRMRHKGIVNEKDLPEYYRTRNLLKSSITAQHVANAVLFFVTRQTPTTGATIPVDGGLPDATPR